MRNLGWTILLAFGAVLSLVAAGFAQDVLFQTHAWVAFFALALGTIYVLRQVDFAGDAPPVDKSGYFDDPIRAGVILTTFWGVVGFLVGVIAALQLAFPVLNIEPYLNFGRLRPLHTSAVIFAFGGTA